MLDLLGQWWCSYFHRLPDWDIYIFRGTLQQLLNGLPALLQRFICFADQSRIEAKCYSFTADQINQARYLQDVLNEWEN
jgi:hypothetical protein